jgi:hypothetical protein
VIGAGGLGSPALLYLAAAGVGTLGIVDDDMVSLSNLQRQILHATGDIGLPKTQSAAHTLDAMNPNVDIVEHNLRLTAENARDDPCGLRPRRRRLGQFRDPLSRRRHGGGTRHPAGRRARSAASTAA